MSQLNAKIIMADILTAFMTAIAKFTAPALAKSGSVYVSENATFAAPALAVKTNIQNIECVNKFLLEWVPQNPNAVQAHYLAAWSFKECDPFDFDCDAAELANCFMELNREGFVNSIKRLFQGDHFYRSDTGQCPRCYRYRPEIHWNNENELNGELCDRCQHVGNDR